MTKMTTEWYRNKTWDREVAEAFEARLKKTKTQDQAQYLRLQAFEIKGVDSSAAISLLERVLTEHRDDQFNYPAAISLLGDIHFAKGEYHKAEEYLRQVQYLPKGTYGSNFPNGFDESDTKLIHIILLTRQKEKYEEMYHLVKKHDVDQDIFKATKFEFFYLSAWLCKEMNKLDEAKEYAQLALNLLANPRPSTPKHPNLGEIQEKPEESKLLNEILNT